MSDLFTAPAQQQDVPNSVEKPELVAGEATQPLVVITEQQVAFGTAAAVPLPRTKPARRVIAALRAMFLSSSEDAQPARGDDRRRHYPPRREEFLEHAAMEREMHRL